MISPEYQPKNLVVQPAEDKISWRTRHQRLIGATLLSSIAIGASGGGFLGFRTGETSGQHENAKHLRVATEIQRCLTVMEPYSVNGKASVRSSELSSEELESCGVGVSVMSSGEYGNPNNNNVTTSHPEGSVLITADVTAMHEEKKLQETKAEASHVYREVGGVAVGGLVGTFAWMIALGIALDPKGAWRGSKAFLKDFGQAISNSNG